MLGEAAVAVGLCWSEAPQDLPSRGPWVQVSSCLQPRQSCFCHQRFTCNEDLPWQLRVTAGTERKEVAQRNVQEGQTEGDLD